MRPFYSTHPEQKRLRSLISLPLSTIVNFNVCFNVCLSHILTTHIHTHRENKQSCVQCRNATSQHPSCPYWYTSTKGTPRAPRHRLAAIRYFGTSARVETISKIETVVRIWLHFSTAFIPKPSRNHERSQMKSLDGNLEESIWYQ